MEWSFESLFGRSLEHHCAIAESSRILIEKLSQTVTDVTPMPLSTLTTKSTRHLTWAVFDLTKGLPVNTTRLNVSWRHKKPEEPVPFKPPLLQVDRYLVGYGEEHGAIKVRFTNISPRILKIHYHEHLPWFMRVYMHTLRLLMNGEPRDGMFIYSLYLVLIFRRCVRFIETNSFSTGQRSATSFYFGA